MTARCSTGPSTNGAWGAWTAVGGLEATSGPSALVVGTTIQLYARGPDSAIWQNALVDGLWRGWVSLGGGFGSAPTASLRSYNGVVDVYGRGIDNHLYYRQTGAAHHRLGLTRRQRDRRPRRGPDLQPDLHHRRCSPAASSARCAASA